MHQSAINSFIDFQKNYLDPSSQKIKIVEVGSKSVNSHIKNLLNKNTDYIGLDIEAGDNVDLVLKDPYKFPIEDSSVDVVISISVFEHSEFFWLTYLEILRILKPTGLFFLNAPSNSKYPMVRSSYDSLPLHGKRWSKPRLELHVQRLLRCQRE